MNNLKKSKNVKMSRSPSVIQGEPLSTETGLCWTSETGLPALVCVDGPTADCRAASHPVLEWGGSLLFILLLCYSSMYPGSRKRLPDVTQGWPCRYLDRTQMPGRYCSSVRTGSGDVRVPPTHTKKKLCITSVNRKKKKKH